MIQTGGVPENLLFMQQGVIKGALISSPTLEKAKELGYKEFLNLAEIKYRYPGTALVTTDFFIRRRPQTVNRFLKATLEGIKYAKANPDFTIRVLGKYTQNSDTKLLASALKATCSVTFVMFQRLRQPKWSLSSKMSRAEIPRLKAQTQNSFTILIHWSNSRRKGLSKNSIRASRRVKKAHLLRCARYASLQRTG